MQTKPNLMQQCRPLPVISDYVRERLPVLANRYQDLSMPEISAALGEFEDLAGSITASSDPLVVLDLKMIYNFTTLLRQRALTAGAEEVVTQAMNVQGEFAVHVLKACKTCGFPLVLHTTYEDIVLNNPPSDLRTYLPGDAGVMEARFYQGHQRIETLLERMITSLARVRDNDLPPEESVAALISARDACRAVVKEMRGFITGIDPAHFKRFREFFLTNPFNGEKGPSGAFTAKIPTVDVLIYGHHLPADVVSYVEDNRKYFPIKDMARIDRLRPAAVSLYDKVVEGRLPEAANAAVIEIAMAMRAFRQTHLGAVHKQIGKAVTGSAEGGDALNLLLSRIKGFNKICEEMKARQGDIHAHPKP